MTTERERQAKIQAQGEREALEAMIIEELRIRTLYRRRGNPDLGHLSTMDLETMKRNFELRK